MAVMFAAVTANAQSLESFKNQLQRSDNNYNSRVTVTEHGTAISAVRSAMASRFGVQSVQGYRVRIFFDNKQNAREKALETERRFKEIFPDIPVYLEYKSPDFKVTVGNCRTREEAIMLKGRIEGMFPTAFVTMEGNIPVAAFGERTYVETGPAEIAEGAE